jgi:hypothetical protein
MVTAIGLTLNIQEDIDRLYPGSGRGLCNDRKTVTV